jgi:hypothetical protein
VGFARVDVGAGETAALQIEVATTAFAERDVASHSMVVRPGTCRLRVAHHAADGGIELSVTVDR